MGSWMQVKTGIPLLLSLAVLPGCAPTHPVTSGFHTALDPKAPKPNHFLVWSNDPNVEPLLIAWVQEQGGTIVEPVRVQEVVQDQHLTLSPTPDLEEALLRVARLVKADEVLVAGVTRRSYPVNWMYSGQKQGGDRVSTLYNPDVTVRSLTVKTGTIRWSVTASGPGPVFTPDRTILELADIALKRAACEADMTQEWRDETGCIGKP